MNHSDVNTLARSRRGGFRRIATALFLLIGLGVSGVAIAGPVSATPTANVKKTVVHTLRAATLTISGAARVGSTLTAEPGSWGPAPVKVKYQWTLAGKAVHGATKKTFKLPASSEGKKVTVKITVSKKGYATASKTSTAKTVAPKTASTPSPPSPTTPPTKTQLSPTTVAPLAPLTLSSSTPTIGGTATVRSTLTAKVGTWTSGTSFTYAWLRNGSAIGGANSATYAPGFGDEGAAISVKVTGSKSGYTTRSVTSAGVTIASPSNLLNGEQLRANQSLRSPNGAYSLVMQGDGNLVEYGPSGAVWATGTGGANRVVLQSDGNLVVYSPSVAKWGSGTDGYGAGVTLSLQDDGNLVLYRNGSAVWTRAVVRWLVVGANARSGSSPGTQSMSGPTLASTQYGVYRPGTKVPVVCGTQRGQGVPGAFTSAKDTTWHRLLGGDWVPDSDFYTGTNGLFAGEPDCTPAGGGTGASKLDSYVAAHPAGSQVGDGQCVALVKDYLRAVWGENPGALGNAIDYRAGGAGGNFLAANGWTWSTKQSFSPGDILVWGAGSYTSSYGHVAIWFNENGHPMYEQNGTGVNGLKIFYGNFFGSGYIGHWHHS